MYSVVDETVGKVASTPVVRRNPINPGANLPYVF